jgi:Protein of unknown function (DUF3300)
MIEFCSWRRHFAASGEEIANLTRPRAPLLAREISYRVLKQRPTRRVPRLTGEGGFSLAPARTRRPSAQRLFRGILALACAGLVALGDSALLAQESTAAPAQKTFSPDQLDSLVAPIALYPDPLLAQTLAASTYPLEVVQLQQWMAKNSNLKDKALADAVATQPWDPSVQSMAAFPDVVKRLGDDIQWANDLGNAFLAQQSDVMDAVQRMRKKAKDKGTLATSEQQTVETKVIEKKEVIVIESSSPDVIYVPSYDPVVVYGAPVYPYPPIYYPYYPYGGAFLAFGFGVAMGAFWGGVWGGCGWGNNEININNNNNFNRGEGNRGDRGNRGEGNRGGDRGNRGGDRGTGNRGGGDRGGNRGGGNWSHNPSHRGGAPYGDRATANKFGGNARGDSLASRQSSARQQISRSGGTRTGGAGVSDRSAGAGSRGGAGVSDRSAGTGNRGGQGRGGSSSGSFNRSGGGDRVGSRDLGGSSSRSRGASGFGGSSSGGFSGSRARSSSSRGGSSFGGGRGGGRGGGGGRRR